MTLQSSGAIAMSEINSEFALGNNMNSYRGTTWWKDDATTGTFSSGSIAFSDFYSKRLTAPGYPGNDGNTKVLLHFDGNYTDVCAGATPHTFNTIGSVTRTSSPVKFGSECLSCPGSSALYTADAADLQITGDITLDAWIYANTSSQTTSIISKCQSSFTCYQLGLSLGKLNGNIRISTTAYSLQSSSAISLNTWHHVALVRNGSSLNIYLDGTSANSRSDVSGSINHATPRPLGIGCNYTTTSSSYFLGYIDEARVSDTARWTSNFTPPTLAYI